MKLWACSSCGPPATWGQLKDTNPYLGAHSHSPKDTRKCLWTVQTNYRFKIRAIFLKGDIIEILPWRNTCKAFLSLILLLSGFMYRKHSMHKKWASITGASWTLQNCLSLILPLATVFCLCVTPLSLLIHYWLMPAGWSFLRIKVFILFPTLPCPLSSPFSTPAFAFLCGELLKSLFPRAQIYILDITSWAVGGPVPVGWGYWLQGQFSL